MILQRQADEGWGAKVIDRLSADLRLAFPDQNRFSARNLKYMRAFAAAWPDPAIVQGPLAQIHLIGTAPTLLTGAWASCPRRLLAGRSPPTLLKGSNVGVGGVVTSFVAFGLFLQKRLARGVPRWRSQAGRMPALVGGGKDALAPVSRSSPLRAFASSRE